MLWFSVPFMGIHAEKFKEFEGMFLEGSGDDETFFGLDPRYKKVREYLVDIYVSAVKEWGLDGLKLDFIDSFVLKGKSLENDNNRDYESLEDAIHALLSETKEKLMQGVIIRHLFLPGKFEQTADVLSWLKENADTKAFISLMNQYTPVPFAEDKISLKKRMDSLSVIENRLVSQTEDMDLQDLIEAFDFDLLFYQELSDDTDWLPDFCRKQPFSNKLAKPIWHCNYGFCQ